MASLAYRSVFTGGEIDEAVRKALTLPVYVSDSSFASDAGRGFLIYNIDDTI